MLCERLDFARKEMGNPGLTKRAPLPRSFFNARAVATAPPLDSTSVRGAAREGGSYRESIKLLASRLWRLFIGAVLFVDLVVDRVDDVGDI